jgi:hypothetical protein
VFVPQSGVLVVPIADTESFTQSDVFVNVKSAVGVGLTQMRLTIVSMPQSIPLPTASFIVYCPGVLKLILSALLPEFQRLGLLLPASVPSVPVDIDQPVAGEICHTLLPAPHEPFV